MKKVLIYLLLGLVAYLLFMVVRFPAEPVVSRLDVRPLTLKGVTGPLWNGQIESIEAPNEALPTGPDTFLLEKVSWRLAPMALLKGNGAANVEFDAYGGQGHALISQALNGDTRIEGFEYSSEGSALSVLLEPLAKISGKLSMNVSELLLKNQLLDRMEGDLTWENAVLLEPSPAKLGQVAIDIKPEGDIHIARINASGGDLEISGSVDVEKNGNFNSDIVIKPQAGAPREITDMLRGIARPASDGSFRIRRSGNANRML